MKFLTHDGLLYFWKKVKSYVNSSIPTSLPANGGNADTLGGRNEKGFVMNRARTMTADQLNNSNWKDAYVASYPTGTDIGLTDSAWWHIMYFPHQDDNGFGAQFALPLNNISALPRYRTSDGLIWGDWKRFGDNGNSDTIDGKHASDFVQMVNGRGVFPKQGGNEGGEIFLERADNSTVNGDFIIDVNGNMLRILETGSPWRGGYIDLTTLGQSASTNLRNAEMVDGYHVAVVSSLPSSQVANTIYFVKG